MAYIHNIPSSLMILLYICYMTWWFTLLSADSSYYTDQVNCLDNKETDNQETGCGCSGSLSRNKEIPPDNGENFETVISQSKPSAIEGSEDSLISKLNVKMAYIAGGDAYIGTNNPIIKTDGEGPQRSVTISSFYMDLYEVSNDGKNAICLFCLLK